MRNKENPLLISFSEYPEEERFNACIKALEEEYTLSFKDICKTLKCSRSWATKYLKPHLHYIFISNGAGRTANYVLLVNSKLNRTNTETTWYSKTEFECFIKNHITEITKQTEVIPIELLIKKNQIKEFQESFLSKERLRETIIRANSDKEIEQLLKKRNEIFKKYASPEGLKIWQDLPTQYKRTDTPSIKCSLKEINIYNLQAVHDLKEYGDTDESVYRNIFISGMYKIIVEIPDEKGNISKKIFYLPDEKNNQNLIHSIEPIFIKYKYVIEYPNIYNID